MRKDIITTETNSESKVTFVDDKVSRAFAETCGANDDDDEREDVDRV